MHLSTTPSQHPSWSPAQVFFWAQYEMKWTYQSWNRKCGRRSHSGEAYLCRMGAFVWRSHNNLPRSPPSPIRLSWFSNRTVSKGSSFGFGDWVSTVGSTLQRILRWIPQLHKPRTSARKSICICSWSTSFQLQLFWKKIYRWASRESLLS